MKNKTNKVLLIIGLVLGILVVGFGSYFVYDKFFSEDDVVDKENDNKENNEEEEFDDYSGPIDDYSDPTVITDTNTNNDFLNALNEKRYFLDLSVTLDNGEFKLDGNDYDFKLDKDGKLLALCYNQETNAYYIKEFSEFGNITKFFTLSFYGAPLGNVVINDEGEIYILNRDYGNEESKSYEYVASKNINNTGKKAVTLYAAIKDDGFFILFEDDSLIEINRDFLISNSKSETSFGQNIKNMNLRLDGLQIPYQCNGFCDSVVIYFDGILKVENNESNFVEPTYNNKTLDFKYVYDELIYGDELAEKSIFNIYFVDTNNNVYVIKNYSDDNKNTKLEKLSYKFDSFSTEAKQAVEPAIYYIVKYSDGSTKEIYSSDFIDLTKYSKIFDLYNKYNKN